MTPLQDNLSRVAFAEMSSPTAKAAQANHRLADRIGKACAEELKRMIAVEAGRVRGNG
jgi:hypothetical protein